MLAVHKLVVAEKGRMYYAAALTCLALNGSNFTLYWLGCVFIWQVSAAVTFCSGSPHHHIDVGTLCTASN